MTASTGELGCCRRSTLKSTRLIRTQNALLHPTFTPFSLSTPPGMSPVQLHKPSLLQDSFQVRFTPCCLYPRLWFRLVLFFLTPNTPCCLIHINRYRLVMSIVINRVIISGRGKQWQIASSKMATAITPGPCALPESCLFPTKKQEVESISPFTWGWLHFYNYPKEQKVVEILCMTSKLGHKRPYYFFLALRLEKCALYLWATMWEVPMLKRP